MYFCPQLRIHPAFSLTTPNLRVSPCQALHTYPLCALRRRPCPAARPGWHRLCSCCLENLSQAHPGTGLVTEPTCPCPTPSGLQAQGHGVEVRFLTSSPGLQDSSVTVSSQEAKHRGLHMVKGKAGSVPGRGAWSNQTTSKAPQPSPRCGAGGRGSHSPASTGTSWVSCSSSCLQSHDSTVL